MSTVGVNDTSVRDQFQCVEGKHHAQQQSYSVVYGHVDETRRKLGISSQGAFQNTRKTPEETKVHERGSLACSRINSVVPVPELNRVNSTGSVDTAVAYNQSLLKNTSEKMDSINTTRRKNSTENTAKMPERPQDLINKMSFGVAKVNVKSSAQYRKSYAFKIWREKGSFPFRLEDQPSTEEQKKSKKYLNAIKSQKDRHNEDAWRAYKSRKTTRKLNKEVEVSSNGNSKEHQTPVTESQEGVTKRDTVHHNNIPCYFKSKKETSPKSQVTLVTKAIPTSVIHVNNTKSYMNCQSEINQALLQETTKVAPTEFRDQPFTRDDTRRSSTVQTVTTGGHGNKPVQRPQIERCTSAENPIPSTTTSVDGHKNKSRSCTTSPPNSVQHLHSPQHAAYSPAKISENHLDLTTDTSEENNDMRGISLEKKLESLDNETLQTVAPNSEVQERSDGHHSPSNHHDNANMIAIMKSTLNKKYCKENVKPAGPGRKRRHENAGNEVGEPQRGRAKQSKGKATVFTRLDETVAINLADGIHHVNSEYFPIDALANKAAKEIGEKISMIKSEPTKISIEKKVAEIDRARLLLKELFDVTSESDGDHEMKTFDVASRSFGRKNILNHLSLLDRYFAEFQNKLSTHKQVC